VVPHPSRPDPANGGPAGNAEGADPAGADAGNTIFDPVTVCDRATYESPIQPSAGIHYVLVNGQAVFKDQELVREALPGKPVRGVRPGGEAFRTGPRRLAPGLPSRPAGSVDNRLPLARTPTEPDTFMGGAVLALTEVASVRNRGAAWLQNQELSQAGENRVRHTELLGSAIPARG
jgi:hypothetical protein